ncbi:hypothetical protein [Enterococcus thailandicus]|uniref:hypothetical protein n=1 Tax=Enterococcus thailandicus TaxID=417368 RepID=UPI0022E487BA|nr:hypothetical protein [Enterococcus thailandicus]
MRIEFPFDEGKSQMVEMFTARHHQSLSDDAVMYEIIFFQAGLTFVLRKWLDHDCSDPIVSLIQPLKMYLK